MRRATARCRGLQSLRVRRALSRANSQLDPGTSAGKRRLSGGPLTRADYCAQPSPALRPLLTQTCTRRAQRRRSLLSLTLGRYARSNVRSGRRALVISSRGRDPRADPCRHRAESSAATLRLSGRFPTKGARHPALLRRLARVRLEPFSKRASSSVSRRDGSTTRRAGGQPRALRCSLASLRYLRDFREHIALVNHSRSRSGSSGSVSSPPSRAGRELPLCPASETRSARVSRTRDTLCCT